MRGIAFALACVLIAGCGGSQEPPKSAESEDVEQADMPEPETKPEPPKADDENGEKQGEDGDGKKPASVPEPEFKDGMSVDDAINAIPQGTTRVNIDNETLGRPLMNEALYKPCKLGPTQHFKLRIAIWDGKAVGMDVTVTPNSDKAAQCIKDQIKGVTWKDAVKSLNTVEYAF
jgi:hypothetical protein